MLQNRWVVIYYDGIKYFPTRTKAFAFARKCIDDANEDGQLEEWATDVHVAEIHAEAVMGPVVDGIAQVELSG